MDVVSADRALLTVAIDRSAESIRHRLAVGPDLRLGAGHGLCAHAQEVLSGILAKAARDASRLDGDPEVRTVRVALTGLRRCLHLLRVLDHALHLIKRPEPGMGLGSLFFIRELATALIGRPVDLVESPRDAPLFETQSWPYRQFVDRPSTTTPMPVILHYPASEASSTLLLPLLVHELGHPVNAECELVETVQNALEADPAWPTVLKPLREALSLEGESPSQATVRVWLSAVIEECVCDALATASLGPSFLLAFAGWAGLDSADEWQENYPPTLLRLELIVQQLEGDGWDLDFAADVIAWIRQLPTALARERPGAPDRSASIRLAAPHIRRVVETHLEGKWPRFLPADYADQVDAGLERLLARTSSRPN